VNDLEIARAVAWSDVLGNRKPKRFGKSGDVCLICKVTKINRYNPLGICAFCQEAIGKEFVKETGVVAGLRKAWRTKSFPTLRAFRRAERR